MLHVTAELDISDNGLLNKYVHHYVVAIVSYCRTLRKQYSQWPSTIDVIICCCFQTSSTSNRCCYYWSKNSAALDKDIITSEYTVMFSFPWTTNRDTDDPGVKEISA